MITSLQAPSSLHRRRCFANLRRGRRQASVAKLLLMLLRRPIRCTPFRIGFSRLPASGERVHEAAGLAAVLLLQERHQLLGRRALGGKPPQLLRDVQQLVHRHCTEI